MTSRFGRDLAGIGATARGRARCTARLEHVEQATEKTIRVSASFNREPTEAEVAEVLCDELFGKKVDIVPGSFRRRDTGSGSRVVLSGFLKAREGIRDLAQKEQLREIASNIYMDDADNSIWKLDQENERLVGTISEDLSEILESASAQVAPGVPRRPQVALASVPESIEGPDNTQYVAYVNPELDVPAVSFGAMVDDDHVLDRATGSVVEIAQNLVVEVCSMRGRDKMLADDTSQEPKRDPMSGYKQSEMVEYYRQVYGYNPQWLDQFEKVINQGAWV